MVEFNREILENGLTVIHEKREGEVATVMFGVGYGAMYESEEEKGIAHFMEHLCFKGTEKRTTQEISKELESVGGELNAFTHEELTAYHVRLPTNYLELAVDVLGDIFFNANFPEEEIEKESNVIIEEIKMYRDNPRAHTMEIIKQNLYEKPYGMFVGGTESTVKSLTREKLIEKHRKIYVPQNSVLCVVGNVEFEDVLSLARKYVGFNRDGVELSGIEVKKKIDETKEKRDGLFQVNLVLGVHFPKLSEENRFAAEVFNSILGEGMSSKLFSEVREKRGLVYGVKSSLDVGRNYGYLLIWAGTDSTKKDEVIQICKEEFFKMQEISEEELKEAKIQVIGSRKVMSEASNDTAVNLMIEEFNGNSQKFYDYTECINKVSLDDVRNLAKNVEFASFVLE